MYLGMQASAYPGIFKGALLERGISLIREDRGATVSRIRNYLRQPHIVISLILLLILIFIVVIPFFRMIKDSFVWQFADIRLSRSAIPGDFTLFHWKRIFASGITRNVLVRPLFNSLSTSLSVSFFAILIGSLLAWLVTRTDLPLRRLIATVAVLPYVIPSYIHALAWLNLFKNDRIGGAAGIFQFLSGVSPPNWLSYGFFPIVFTLSIHYFPYTFLLVSLPALLSSFILTFSRVVGTFGTPYFLGTPVRFFTLSTQIYTNIINRVPAAGYILTFVLIAISSVIIYFNQKLIGKKKSFVTIAGKGFSTSLTSLGTLKYPALTVVIALLIASVVLPFILLAWQTFTLYPDDYSIHHLTPLFWIGEANTAFAEGEAGILRNPAIIKTAWNSIKLALVAAILSGFLGIFIGYAVVKGRNTKLANTVEQMFFLPYLVPGIAFGALYLSIFTHKIGPIPALYGTFFLVALVCIAKNLPFTGRAGITSMLQIGNELEEASETLGARWSMRFRKIILPLSIQGALSGFILVFITVMRELSLIILLVTPGTRTLTTMTFRYQEQGYTQFSSAISVLIIIIVIAGELFSKKLGKKTTI
jgi:iron(III) transport system permease protein